MHASGVQSLLIAACFFPLAAQFAIQGCVVRCCPLVRAPTWFPSIVSLAVLSMLFSIALLISDVTQLQCECCGIQTNGSKAVKRVESFCSCSKAVSVSFPTKMPWRL